VMRTITGRKVDEKHPLLFSLTAYSCTREASNVMTASSRENIFMEREVQSVKSGVVLSYPAGNGVIYFSPNNLRPPGGLSAVIDVYIHASFSDLPDRRRLQRRVASTRLSLKSVGRVDNADSPAARVRTTKRRSITATPLPINPRSPAVDHTGRWRQAALTAE